MQLISICKVKYPKCERAVLNASVLAISTKNILENLSNLAPASLGKVAELTDDFHIEIHS